MRSCPKCGNSFSDDTKFCPKDGSALGPEVDEEAADPLLGTLIDRYRLVSKLGEGGMGMVYKAEHTMIGRPVALKLLHPDLSRVPQAVDRFFREARAANEINSEHIVQVTDFGETENGSNFLVMEYLVGKSLRDELLELQSFEPSRAVHIATQIVKALDQAHQKGVIHRDLKPANIQLVQQGSDKDFVKLLDFGIAKITESGTQLTQTGMILGSPAYMSPEQASGAKVDHRTDIYSLGIILYEMLVGAPPFTGDSPTQILLAHASQDPVPPKVSQPNIPEELNNLIMQCLAKDPQHRPSTMNALLERLQRWQEQPASPVGRAALAGAGVIPQTVRASDQIAFAETNVGTYPPPDWAHAGAGGVAPTVVPSGAPPQVFIPQPGPSQPGSTQTRAGMAESVQPADQSQPGVLLPAGHPQAGVSQITSSGLPGPATAHGAPLGTAPQMGNKKYLVIGLLAGGLMMGLVVVLVLLFFKGDRPSNTIAAKTAASSKTLVHNKATSSEKIAAPGRTKDEPSSESEQPVPSSKGSLKPAGQKGRPKTTKTTQPVKVQPETNDKKPILPAQRVRPKRIASSSPPSKQDIKSEIPKPPVPETTRPTRPKVRIVSIPAGAAIHAGGKFLGRTPRSYYTDRPFRLTLSKRNFRLYEMSVKKGTKGTIQARLEKLPEYLTTRSFGRLKTLYRAGQMSRFQWRMRIKVMKHEMRQQIEMVHMDYRAGRISRPEKRRRIREIKESWR